MIRVKRLTALCICICVLCSLCLSAGAEEGSFSVEEEQTKKANDITLQCRYRGQMSSGASIRAALDHGLFDAFYPAQGERYIDIYLPEGTRCGGLFMDFLKIPSHWAVYAVTESGDEFLRAEGEKGSDRYQEFADLRWMPIYGHVRLYADPVGLMELRVFDDTGPFDDPLLRRWEARPEKADLMVVSAHPDDEIIFMGGVLPTYAGQMKKDTVVVYMSCNLRQRASELLNGLWISGVRQYPVIGSFPDVRCYSLREAREHWADEDCQRYLVEQIRRYRPDVMAAQDLKGEYGHGAHMLTAETVRRAVRLAAIPEAFPDLAEQYGVWQVKKLYLHLYPKNPITMDWRKPLDAFDGLSALEVAQMAILEHQSQPRWHDRVRDTGPFSNAQFGLYCTSVGPDKACDDFFEHIPDTENQDS